MKDSSEHVTEPTKMIGFDLERARGLRDFLQDDCAEVGDIWGEMIAEIERLRPFEIAARDLDSDLGKIAGERDEQAARIRELGGMLSIRTEELEIAHSCARSEREMHEKELAVFARKINDLEDALVEKQTALMPSAPRCYADARRQAAIEQLQAEGKIGPGARPPCWQITEERKAAIWHAVAVLKENDPDDEHLWDEEIAVLRAMLREAE